MGPPVQILTMLAVLGGAALLTNCSNEPTTPQQREHLSPLYKVNGADRAIEEGVIVMLRDRDADPRAFAQAIISTHGGRLRFLFNHGTKGFSAILPSVAVEALRRTPAVRIIEPIRSKW